MSLKRTRNDLLAIENGFKENAPTIDITDNYIELMYINSVLSSLEALKMAADKVSEVDYLHHWSQVLYFMNAAFAERSPLSYNPRLPDRETISKQETARRLLQRLFDEHNATVPVFDGYAESVKKTIKDFSHVFEAYRLLYLNCKRTFN